MTHLYLNAFSNRHAFNFNKVVFKSGKVMLLQVSELMNFSKNSIHYVSDLDAMRTQSLLICERILGEQHKDTLFRLMYRGAAYADALRYQRCIDLWRRALEIRIMKDSVLSSDTCFPAQALVRLFVDLNENLLLVHDAYGEMKAPQFEDVASVFLILAQPLVDSRPLLEVRCNIFCHQHFDTS